MKEMVSIIIPAFNAASTLAETLASALNQTHRELEVIIVDDGSTDRTAEIATQFAEVDPRCRCIRQANGGQPSALNRGIEEARGEYITFLDADDLYGPRKVEKQLRVLRSTTRQVVLTQLQRFMVTGSQRREMSSSAPPEWEGQRLYLRTILLLGAFQMALLTTAMMRRQVLLQVGKFDPALPTAKDWDLWLRLAAAGYGFANVQEPLYFYRKYAGSLSLRHGLRRTLTTQLRILEKHKPSGLISARLYRQAKAKRYIEHLRFLSGGDFRLGLDILLQGCWDARIYLDAELYRIALQKIRT